MLLLDSHVLIWLLRGDGRLGSKTQELLVSQHPVYYSAVSVLELTIKALMGRIDLPNTLSAALEEEGLRQMPLTGEHAELLADFPELLGHDPFDRALVAQARAENLTFVTADRRLLSLGRTFIHDASA